MGALPSVAVLCADTCCVRTNMQLCRRALLCADTCCARTNMSALPSVVSLCGGNFADTCCVRTNTAALPLFVLLCVGSFACVRSVIAYISTQLVVVVVIPYVNLVDACLCDGVRV
jgi:hypothetical protein